MPPTILFLYLMNALLALETFGGLHLKYNVFNWLFFWKIAAMAMFLYLMKNQLCRQLNQRLSLVRFGRSTVDLPRRHFSEMSA